MNFAGVGPGSAIACKLTRFKHDPRCRRHELLQVSGMAGLLNDAVDQAERLAGENKELRRKQEDAVLDKCAPAASNAVG